MIFTCGKRVRRSCIARKLSSRRSRPSQSTVTTSCSFAFRRSSSSSLGLSGGEVAAAQPWASSAKQRGAIARARGPNIAHPYAHGVPGKDRGPTRVPCRESGDERTLVDGSWILTDPALWSIAGETRQHVPELRNPDPDGPDPPHRRRCLAPRRALAHVRGR